MPDHDSGYADLAAEYLTAATDDVRLRPGPYKTWNGCVFHPSHQVDAPERMLLAVAGIGQALLAIREDAVRQSGDLADLVHSVADMLGDLQVPADRVADALTGRPRGRRWLPRRLGGAR